MAARRRLDAELVRRDSLADAVGHGAIDDSEVTAGVLGVEAAIDLDIHRVDCVVDRFDASTVSGHRVNVGPGMSVPPPIHARVAHGAPTGEARCVQTIWVLGDQLNRQIGALADADPATHRILLVEDDAPTRRHLARAVEAQPGFVLQAAADEGVLGIGVDSNQNWMHPGSVLTSMLKRVDVATYTAMMDAEGGTWTPGIQVLGLAEDGVGYAMDENNEALVTADMITAVEAAKAGIIAGDIEVHNYMTDDSCPVM